MFVTPPTFNYWQCVVVDQQQNVLTAQSSSNIIAYNQVKVECNQDTVYCNPAGISCQFNTAPQVPSCTVVDNIGQKWVVQAPYQPCNRALLQCQQTHALNLRYSMTCTVVN